MRYVRGFSELHLLGFDRSYSLLWTINRLGVPLLPLHRSTLTGPLRLRYGCRASHPAWRTRSLPLRYRNLVLLNAFNLRHQLAAGGTGTIERPTMRRGFVRIKTDSKRRARINLLGNFR